jgi:ribonuclease HIII
VNAINVTNDDTKGLTDTEIKSLSSKIHKNLAEAEALQQHRRISI